MDLLVRSRRGLVPPVTRTNAAGLETPTLDKEVLTGASLLYEKSLQRLRVGTVMGANNIFFPCANSETTGDIGANALLLTVVDTLVLCRALCPGAVSGTTFTLVAEHLTVLKTVVA